MSRLALLFLNDKCTITKTMKAVILAAGRGVRLMPLTANTPKPLLKYKGKTLLEHIFEELPEGIDEVIAVVGYLGEKIKDYLGNEYKGKKIKYANGSEKGNAYSLLAAKTFFRAKERFLVLYSDDLISQEDIKKC